MTDDTNDLDQVWPEWKEAVNMSASQLEKWLDTEESRSVGQKESRSAESVGHESGRHIIEILNTKRDDLTDDDVEHMHKVVGYVHRHLAQRPTKEDIESSKWRYSLMNWGHDPLK
ncbi:DUF3140 domain-containing protein [Arthrobacter burdickii]|uniref:DUF3140 domain-containing protein n=1 Tax=Arthrobacter burdickii TaxID=3035920 RepID=A0ABT8K5T8_9MICC|nr:DUF3140 domain-containing protein [Arthrobacter burdickii]MDN4612181.1 DUF3140 domain-containing protein [Arthrobacter burdickii]